MMPCTLHSHLVPLTPIAKRTHLHLVSVLLAGAVGLHIALDGALDSQAHILGDAVAPHGAAQARGLCVAPGGVGGFHGGVLQQHHGAQRLVRLAGGVELCGGAGGGGAAEHGVSGFGACRQVLLGCAGPMQRQGVRAARGARGSQTPALTHPPRAPSGRAPPRRGRLEVRTGCEG